MSSITCCRSESESDLHGIIELQRLNLRAVLSEQEKAEQGFLTVVHDLDMLSKLNEREKHVIVKKGDRVIAYLLAMTAASKNDIPVLVPMFSLFDNTRFRGKPVSGYNYIVVGQVCVDKAYRGQGVLDACYDFYRTEFRGKYDFAITEIDTANRRSVRAHQRIGFEELVRHHSADQIEWSIVLWNWNREC